jgi:hypothetical protein
VIDVDIENNFSQEDEGVHQDGQTYNERSDCLRIPSSPNELNYGRDANHN